MRRLQGHRRGAVLGAVTEVLADGTPRPLADIHAAVERLLGGSVARATVTKHRSSTTTTESRRSESAAESSASSPAVTNLSVSEPRETPKPAATTPSTGPEAQVDAN